MNDVFLTTIILIIVISAFFNFIFLVGGQQEREYPSAYANVSVLGGIAGPIQVYHNPVNFAGVMSGTNLNLKVQNDSVGYISVNVTTNVNWNLWMNMSNLVAIVGPNTYLISPGNVSVNSTCTQALPGAQPLKPLSFNPQKICGQADLNYNALVDVYFWLNVPSGQYNATYFADLTIFVNSSLADNNVTWNGPNNVTNEVLKTIEIRWNQNTTPINFQARPGETVNATNITVDNTNGWPTNITNGRKTNIPLDFYINGTDFVNVTNNIVPSDCPNYLVGSQCKFESQNATYSNASAIFVGGKLQPLNWPDDSKALTESFYATTFENWYKVKNDTETPVWWSIHIPGKSPEPALPGGSYRSDIILEAVDHGKTPV